MGPLARELAKETWQSAENAREFGIWALSGGMWRALGREVGPAFQTLNSFPRKLVGIEDPAHCRELPQRRAWFPLHRGTRCARAGIEKRH